MSDTVRVWRHIQQRYNLIGSKCTTCGKVFFPNRIICPDCRRKGHNHLMILRLLLLML